MRTGCTANRGTGPPDNPAGGSGPGASAFHGDAGELRFAGGPLQADTNRDGVANFEIKLAGVSSLVNSDLVS